MVLYPAHAIWEYKVIDTFRTMLKPTLQYLTEKTSHRDIAAPCLALWHVEFIVSITALPNADKVQFKINIRPTQSS